MVSSHFCAALSVRQNPNRSSKYPGRRELPSTRIANLACVPDELDLIAPPWHRVVIGQKHASSARRGARQHFIPFPWSISDPFTAVRVDRKTGGSLISFRYNGYPVPCCEFMPRLVVSDSRHKENRGAGAGRGRCHGARGKERPHRQRQPFDKGSSGVLHAIHNISFLVQGSPSLQWLEHRRKSIHHTSIWSTSAPRGKPLTG